MKYITVTEGYGKTAKLSIYTKTTPRAGVAKAALEAVECKGELL
jgi:hypothetical protein